MTKVLVRAGEGRRVRLGAGIVLDQKATKPVLVERTIYIERRLQCGDLVEVKEETAKPAPPEKPAEALKAEAPPTPAPPPAPKPATADVKAS